MTNAVYDKITDQLIAALEQGTAPKRWTSETNE